MPASVKVIKNGFISVNSVNLSAQLKELTLTYEVEELDKAAMGDATALKHPGLKNWRITAKFFQNYGSGSLNTTLFALVGSETAVPVEVRAENAAVSASNPKFTGSGYVVKFPPLAAAHGQIVMSDVEIAPAGDLAMAEA